MQRFQEVRPALGSQAVLTLVVPNTTATTQLFENLWAQIEAFEQRFSRFRPDSELTFLNASAGKQVPASPQLLALVQTCTAMTANTNGLFNPFILPALQKAGYIGSWPNPETSNGLEYHMRSQHIATARFTLGADWVQIPADTAVEFGGIGKGYLLDELGTYLQTQSVSNFWLSLGGDILCAGYNLDLEPWSIGVQHAAKPGVIIDQLINKSGTPLGIATSGTTKRKGIQNGQTWHHIIDPSTGLPSTTTIATATVTATSATKADVYAKCAVLHGEAHLQQFFDTHDMTALQAQLTSGEIRAYTAS